MSDLSPWWYVGLLAVVLVVVWVVRWLMHFGEVVQAERARELFRLQHERFEAALLTAAAASGKPRGLRWVSCLITGPAVLVRERPTHRIVALVPVTVQFEAIEGSEMEDAPLAAEPRPTTAIFTFAKGEWATTGRVLFNLDPQQTVHQSAGRYQWLDHHSH